MRIGDEASYKKTVHEKREAWEVCSKQTHLGTVSEE